MTTPQAIIYAAQLLAYVALLCVYPTQTLVISGGLLVVYLAMKLIGLVISLISTYLGHRRIEKVKIKQIKAQEKAVKEARRLQLEAAELKNRKENQRLWESI